MHTIETNVHGTEVVLKHANKKKKLVRHRLHLGGLRQEHRGAVPRGRATSCSARRSKHRWAYACSKAIDEFLALAYWKEKKLPVIIVRLLQHGRPAADRPVRDGRSRTSCGRRWPGEPITVFGDGTQTRSFTYVGDVVGALRDARRRSRARSARSSTSATAEEISIRELAERVKALTGERVADRDHPVRPGVRGRVRGHAAARARHPQDPRADRLRADASSSTRSSSASSTTSGRAESHVTSAQPPARAPRRRDGCSLRNAKPRPPRCCSSPGRDRAPRLPEIVQIESTNICNAQVRLLPARRHEAPAGRHGHGALPEGRRRVRGARHRPRADAQLRRAVRRPAARREGRATPSRRASPRSA